MSYAIIKINHRQFIVKPGDSLILDGTLSQEGETLSIGQALLIKDDRNLNLGQPFVEGNIILKIKKHLKSPKVKVATYKAKSRYRRTKGHRQGQTEVEVISVAGLKSDSTKPAPKTAKKVDVKKPAATAKTKKADPKSKTNTASTPAKKTSKKST